MSIQGQFTHCVEDLKVSDNTIKKRINLSILLLIIILPLSLFFIFKYDQLVIGDADYFWRGRKLIYDGQFPSIVRPPGYPLFVAGVLAFFGEKGNKFNDMHSVRVVQCILLYISAVVLFLWMSNHFNIVNAFISALLLGTNALILILTGYTHYESLHIFFTIISCYILNIAIHSSSNRNKLVFISGLCWGLTTVIRPMTLILPAFILIVFLIKLKFSWKTVIKKTAIFTFGMLVVLGPLTIRNYLLTNRLIFVNAQGGIALWGSTVEKLPQDNVDDPWKIIWYRHGMPIFSKITGSSTYKSRLFYKNILKLNQEFKKQAIANILHRPDIYFHNIIRNFILFTFGNSKGMIIRFIMIQPINEKQSQHFFSQLRTQKISKNVLSDIEELKEKHFLNRREINQEIKRKIGVEQYYKVKKQLYNCFLNSDLLAVIVSYKMLTGVLALLGILGICVAIYKKDTALLIPVTVFISFCIAHSITYSNYRYLYIKIPFLIIFYGYLMDRTEMYRIKIPILNKQCPIYIICHILMFSWSIGTTFALMSAV